MPICLSTDRFLRGIWKSVYFFIFKIILGNSLTVQWIEFSSFTAASLDLIHGQGTKFSEATWSSKRKKKKINIYIYIVYRILYFLNAIFVEQLLTAIYFLHYSLECFFCIVYHSNVLPD